MIYKHAISTVVPSRPVKFTYRRHGCSRQQQGPWQRIIRNEFRIGGALARARPAGAVAPVGAPTPGAARGIAPAGGVRRRRGLGRGPRQPPACRTRRPSSARARPRKCATPWRRERADLVLVNHDLSPAQERNLEKIVGCRVLDRTGLILDIFAQRAHSHEGKLQVELAQLEHLSTRLVRGWTHLERQKGGIGLRGPGETQLETDRRLIRDRIKQLHGGWSRCARSAAAGARRAASAHPHRVAGGLHQRRQVLAVQPADLRPRCTPPTSCSPRSIRPCGASSCRARPR
jgi:hypothetical protein